MRWFWIDRFVEFESGRRAVAIKNVTLVEEPLDDYLPGYPVLPSSLIVEGLAQTGGLLVAEHHAFRARVVLAKVGKAVFHQPALPGECLTYTAEILDLQPDGAIVGGTSRVGDRVQAEIELFFGLLTENQFRGDLFEPEGLLRMCRLFGMYDVGRRADGSPLTVPDHMLEAEARDNAMAA